MLDESKSATLAEMNQAKVEDLDFPGLKAAGRSAEEQAASILEAMTFEEKAGFISGYKSLGIRALPRLGLPSVWMSDATSGVRSYGPAAAFPSGVAMAASWDRQLIARAAGSIAETARAKGISILLGPGVNIARIPTCGRNFEYFGEDPFLAGEMAAAYISACSKKGVICTVKHLAANNSEYDRHKISSDMDERTLRELYLPAFESAVKKGGATALMTAYNPINGVWASENRRLITDILRGEWGFEGMVISDWNSLYSTSGPMNAGMDLEMPQARWLSRERIQKAVESGEVPQQKLDDMCGRILRTLFTAGVYSRPVKDTDSREFHEEHNKRALQTAEAGIVLLKNNNKALPLPRREGATIVLCGPLAGKSSTSGGGSCHVYQTTGTVHLADGLKEALSDLSASAARTENAGRPEPPESSAGSTRVVCLPWKKNGRLNAAGRQAVKTADAVVIACGFNYLIESEFYDRPWKLPRAQRKLIRQAAALNSRSIVVLSAGGGVETESWSSAVPAIVHGMYLGQSVGLATANVLLGKVNPSGRLPFTMARRWHDIPAVKNYPRRYWTTSAGRMLLGQGNPRFRRMRHWKYSEGLMTGYRHFDTAGVAPAFPFGHGLSYTSFTLEKMECTPASIAPGQELTVRVQVRNTGEVPGAAVVQVYVRDVQCRLPRPEKELKGFEKIYLEPDEHGEVSITLNARAFCFWDPRQAASTGDGWTAEEGEFEILAGESSRNISCRQTILLK